MVDRQPDPLAARARQARAEVERALDPEPPPFARGHAPFGGRRVLAAAAIVAVVIVVVAVVAVLGDGTKDERLAAPRPVQLIRSDLPRSAGAQGEIPKAVASDTAFAVDLYRQLAATQSGNFFVSPHSISMALAMTLVGTAGATKAQLERAMHLSVPEPAFRDALNALDRSLTAPRKVEDGSVGIDPLALTTANSLWGQAGFPFRQMFLDRLAGSFGAGMHVVDFQRAADASRRQVNAWVASHTKGKITELIQPGVIDDMTRLVLVNTITFKASWATPFEKAVPERFTTADGSSVLAQMMHGGYGELATGPGWQAASLPYQGGAHMVVIVPSDLAAFDPVLSPAVLDQAVHGTEFGKVTLPKFSVTTHTRLDHALGALGVRDLFDPDRADLSGMDGRRDLYVSAVVHQANIEVDEQGTKAEAATGVVGEFLSAGGPSLVVDRPFVFAIRDDATGAILFAGRVTDPTTS